jgi:hypothetical protein
MVIRFYTCFFLVAIFFCHFEANAQNGHQADKVQHKFILAMSAGYQKENFRWSIAGNSHGQNPNIKSELIWKNLQGPGIEAAAGWNFWKQFFLEINYKRSTVRNGSATDTDYSGDDRTDQDVSSSLLSNHGKVMSGSFSLGYKVLQLKRFYMMPMVGYVLHKQTLYLNDNEGFKLANELNSSYKTTWNGLMFRLKSELWVAEKLSVNVSAAYQQLNYKAQADWDLVDEFEHPVSFEHEAYGYTAIAGIGLNIHLNSLLNVSLSGDQFYRITGKGTDRLFLTDGTIPQTQYNGAVNSGSLVSLGIKLSF